MPHDPSLSQQRLIKIVDEIEDYAIILLDREGNIENWNKGAKKIKGYAESEILGKNFSIFYTPKDKAAQLPKRLIEQAARNGKVEHEGWRLRKDGTCFWGSLVITAIHGDDGNVIGFTKVMRDLTIIHLAQESLRKSEERYIKMVQEVSDYAIILLDTDGNIENWNKGAQLIKGYSSDEIIGKNFRIFYLEEDQQGRLPERLINEATLQGRAQHEGWRLRKDGSRFWGLISITALHNQEQEIIGFSKVTKDLTERLTAEKKQQQYIADLAKKNNELEQFTYIASHDLQEPLRTISSFNELLKEAYYDELDEQGKMFIDVIEKAAERMRNLILGILDYSHIGAKQALVNVDCNKLLTNIENDLSRLISETGTHIYYTALPVITGYETALTQLFQNLISNAIKYSKKEVTPEITINAEKKGEHWLFSVKDNGIGMNPEYIPKIFQIFQRLHNRDEYPGSGIGLANCKKVVELHKGEIWAESLPGEGSTFYFTISIHL